MKKIPKKIVETGRRIKISVPDHFDEDFKADIQDSIDILTFENDYLKSYSKLRKTLAKKDLTVFDIPPLYFLIPIYAKSLAPSMHVYMLNDKSRNESFYKAISKCLKRSKSKRILDIGSGSGILSMMCSSLAADVESIVAVEVNEFVSDLCSLNLRENDLSKKIKLFNKKSHKLEKEIDFDNRFDLLVCEVIADNIISEGMINTINHAHRELLKENSEVIPKRSRLYGVLVEDYHLKDQSHFPDTVCGFSMKGMKSILNDQITYPDEYFVHSLQNTKFLSDSFEIFEFDFTKMIDPEGESRHDVNINISGEVHGILLYFELDVDDDITIKSLDETSCWIPKFIPLYGSRKADANSTVSLSCSYKSGLPWINIDWHDN